MGLVHLYRVSGDRVTLDSKLHSREPANWSQFGDGVSLAGGRLAVSAPGSPTDPQRRPGAVHVFERCDGRWTEALLHRTSADEAVLLGRRVFLAGDVLGFHAGTTLGTARLVGGCARR
jgi:hypothetical protein